MHGWMSKGMGVWMTTRNLSGWDERYRDGVNGVYLMNSENRDCINGLYIMNSENRDWINGVYLMNSETISNWLNFLSFKVTITNINKYNKYMSGSKQKEGENK